MNDSTANDRLIERARTEPDALYLRYLHDGTPSSAEDISYGALLADASRVAAALERTTEPGEPVMLLFTPGPAFVRGFWGVLLAGRVAVPAFPPDPTRLQRTLGRLLAIVDDVGARTIVTSSLIAAQAEALGSLAPGLTDLTWVVVDTLEEEGEVQGADPEQVAFIQYTSGSTGQPRGVVVTHGQLAAQCEMLAAMRIPGEMRQVGWTPFYHDMGLMMGHFFQLFAPCETTWMSPLQFIRDPLSWLEAATHYRATSLVGPDFAFSLAARKATPQRTGPIDLGSVSIIVSSAEPVREASVLAFCQAFDVDPAVFRPAFGLAENTLVATGGVPLTVLRADPDALAEGIVVPSDAGSPLVASGSSLAGRVAIVDPETRVPLDELRVGEIWLDQPSRASGYWNRPDLTERLFQATTADGDGPWLRTGDLGFLHEGQLYVTGRAKDLIVLRGQNLYPQDIEAAVESAHPSIRPGCVIAFAVAETHGEGIGIAAEIRDRSEAEAVQRAIQGAVHEALQVRVTYLALLKPRSLPKTSSGKLQRSAVLPGIEDGTLEPWLLDDQTREVDSAEVLEELIERLIDARLEPGAETMTLAELGMDSVRVSELRSHLQQRTGIELGLQTLSTHSTLGALVQWIRTGAVDDLPDVIQIPSLVAAPPLVLVPGAYGAADHIHDLGASMAAHRPVFILEAPYTPGETPIDDVRELARWYFERAVQLVPTGPIHVAGYSFGSLVAIELARLLQRAGRVVPAVCSIDGGRWRISRREWVRTRILRREPNLNLRYDAGRPRAMMAASRRAFFAYEPEPYWGRVVVFTTHMSQPADRTFLESFCRRLRIETIPGDHHKCVKDPHLPVLVEKLEHVLQTR